MLALTERRQAPPSGDLAREGTHRRGYLRRRTTMASGQHWECSIRRIKVAWCDLDRRSKLISNSPAAARW